MGQGGLIVRDKKGGTTMQGHAMIMASALLLAACGSGQSDAPESAVGETASYSIDQASGETAATIETEDGTARVRSGESVPVNLPKGFSLYPGAKVTNNTTFALEGTSGAMIVFESDDGPEEIAQFYRKQAEAAGVTIELEMSVNGGKVLGGDSAQGHVFTLNSKPGEGSTTTHLMVGEKPRP